MAVADPRLEGKYPIKGLYQALAVAAMCLQEEASIRPLISDVVIALEYLANPRTNDLEEPTPEAEPIARSVIVEDTRQPEEKKSELDDHIHREIYSSSSREDESNDVE